MKVLYIFPHPDDESFGPAVAMNKQQREGHEVYLLTLTKGEATKVRFTLGISKEEMGNLRLQEMEDVAQVLSLKDLTVLDLPDGILKEIDPRKIEEAVKTHVEKVRPDVIVTYPVHGISGFHDHLITHGVVKRVFEEMRSSGGGPKRLAFYTLTEEDSEKSTHFRLSHSKPNEIDCYEKCSEEDLEKTKAALDCYKTYLDTIHASGIKDILSQSVAFEFYQEEITPSCESVFSKLN